MKKIKQRNINGIAYCSRSHYCFVQKDRQLDIRDFGKVTDWRVTPGTVRSDINI